MSYAPLTQYPYYTPPAMPRQYTPLLFVLPILMVDAIIEVGMVGEMVGFLHDRAGKWFDVNYPDGSTFQLHGKPKGLLVDQGHTSNGAAGTALMLVGVGGLLMIWIDRRRARNQSTFTRLPGNSTLFKMWLTGSILSTLLTLAALIYTFVLTSHYSGQQIDLSVAAAHPEPQLYPLDHWTPQNWFGAILSQVPLAKDSDRRKIRQELRIMHGWQYNLIPLFILGVVVLSVGVMEFLKQRRMGDGRGGNRTGAKMDGF